MLFVSILLGCLSILLQDFVHAVNTNLMYSLQMLNVTIRRNTRFENADSLVLNSFIDMSIDQCILECDSRPGCKAVENRHMAKHCSLRTDISITVMAPGFLTVAGFDGTKQCGNAWCSTKEACDADTSTCLVKECGYPGTKRNFNGNRFEIGNKIRCNCSENDEERFCTDDGTWQTLRQGVITHPGLTCRDARQASTNAINVQSGFYRNALNMTMYCEFDSSGGGDWLVFQKRNGGSVDFYRNWQEYKTGFGFVCDEFWLGLENLHTILRASSSQFELRIDLEDWDGNTRFAVYDTFDLGDESDGYRLHTGAYSGRPLMFTSMLFLYMYFDNNSRRNTRIALYETFDLGDESGGYRLHVGAYSGTAGDGIGTTSRAHNGQMFSTYDTDNDIDGSNCAVKYHGAWWYNTCHISNLNGRYYMDGHNTDYARGVVWYPWTGYNYSLRNTTMKIREKID